MGPEKKFAVGKEWSSTSDRIGKILALQVIVGNTALVVGLANHDSSLAFGGIAVGWVAPRLTMEITSRLPIRTD